MNLELKKRIVTSIILFLITIICILFNKILFLITFISLLFICFYEWGETNNYYFKIKNKFFFRSYLFINIIGLIFLVLVFISTISLKGNSYNEAFFLIVIIMICSFSDMGGYTFGKLIGGKRLTKISPNKTISGCIGSFIFSFLPLILLNSQNYFNFNFEITIKNIFLILLVSLVCQIGDLIISFFKRLNKKKNTGTILPGHGGLLDRIDGLIFVIPVIYFLKLVNIF